MGPPSTFVARSGVRESGDTHLTSSLRRYKARHRKFDPVCRRDSFISKQLMLAIVENQLTVMLDMTTTPTALDESMLAVVVEVPRTPVTSSRRARPDGETTGDNHRH